MPEIDEIISREIADLDDFLKSNDLRMNYNKYTISFSKAGKVMFSIRRSAPANVLASCVELLRRLGEVL